MRLSKQRVHTLFSLRAKLCWCKSANFSFAFHSFNMLSYSLGLSKRILFVMGDADILNLSG